MSGASYRTHCGYFGNVGPCCRFGKTPKNLSFERPFGAGIVRRLHTIGRCRASHAAISETAGVGFGPLESLSHLLGRARYPAMPSGIARRRSGERACNARDRPKG